MPAFRLITRDGNDFTSRFLLAAAAVSALPARSFLIDGEAIVTNGNGLAVFDPIRRKRNGGAAVLIAFDLIKLMSHSITVLAWMTEETNWSGCPKRCPMCS